MLLICFYICPSDVFPLMRLSGLSSKRARTRNHGENGMVSVLLVDCDFEKTSELPCTAGVRCLAWSKDSRYLAAGGEDLCALALQRPVSS